MTPLSICRFSFCLLALSAAAVAADEPTAPAKPKMTTGELAAWIDQEFEKEWAASSITPPAVVDDATFLKRVSLDLTGSIPSVSLARDFLEYSGAHDRGVLVDRFLNERRRPEKFADRTAAHWATLWRRMMVPGNTPQAQMATALEPWIKQQFVENIPYDQFARSLITATNNGQTAMVVPGRPGMEMSATPAMFYQAVGGKPENAASSLTRVFLGTRIGCAECHDHPTAEWKQKDFWGMAAFFSGINNGVVGDVASPKITATTQGNTVEYVGKFLDGREPPATSGKTPRQILADWMVAPENKQFAATAVNRIWLYLLGQGMTEAVDDLDQASPGERRILDELAQKFVESGYDVHWLISGICKSQVYQRECVHSDDTEAAPSAGLRVVKALTPEQVFDSLEQALVLPVSRVDGSARFNGLRNQLIARMNEAASNNPGDYKAGIPQALLLMNGRLTAEATDLDQSRTLRGVLDAPFLGTQQKLDTLYLATFSRRPNSDENTFLLDYVQKQTAPDKQNEAFAEIFWGLLNSPEFVLER
jgi:hypothetical protein